MKIFDLDGTLADCEHRRHLVDPLANGHYVFGRGERPGWINPSTGEKFKPRWKEFFEACDKDKRIHATCNIVQMMLACDDDPYFEIWSGRCESVRQKTIDWLEINIDPTKDWGLRLKMRPIGDSTPDDQLKEKWLDEASAEGEHIEFVFDDRPKVVRMWRRRGIFVFNCAQHDGEF